MHYDKNACTDARALRTGRIESHLGTEQLPLPKGEGWVRGTKPKICALNP
jgi:hypothetical protein